MRKYITKPNSGMIEPCPFCGSECLLALDERSDSTVRYEVIFVACTNETCGATGKSFTHYYGMSAFPEVDAIAWWNRRANYK